MMKSSILFTLDKNNNKEYNKHVALYYIFISHIRIISNMAFLFGL